MHFSPCALDPVSNNKTDQSSLLEHIFFGRNSQHWSSKAWEEEQGFGGFLETLQRSV